MRFTASFTALAAFVSAASALTLPLNRHSANNTIIARQDTGPKQVFAHFMLGIVASYSVADWEQDIKQAKGVGIDGFALNSGNDDYTRDQLHNAYQAAKNVGDFKLFISFDFTSLPQDVNMIASLIKEFADEEAQLKIGDKMFVSTFYGEGFQFRAAEAAAGVPLFSCPAWGPEALKSADADCGFQWNSWPSQDNKPVDQPMTLDGDKWWQTNLAGKPYMAGASPWFFTHFGESSGFPKNYLFKSDTLWTDRWQMLLDLAPQFIEIITWNDYGESHYIGPLRDDKPDVYAGGAEGAVKWTPGHDHSAWATVAAPYIAAYKQGANAPIVSSEHLVYYYRQQSNSLQCSDPLPAPDGAPFTADAVFVTALLTEPGTIVITSGGNAPVSIEVDAGVHTVSAPMGVGKQSFALVRGGNNVLSGDGYRDIRDSCDVYDFNPFVGEISGGGGQSAPGPVAPVPETPAPETPSPATETPASTPTPESAPGPVAAPPADSPAPASSKSVSFSTQHETVWGDNIYISGNVDALGNWDASRAVMLHTDETTYPTWNTNVDLPAGTEYDYKYILKTSDGQVTWEGETQHATA